MGHSEMDFGSLFTDDLQSGETLHWTARPDPKLWLNRSDLFLIPMGLFMLSISIFWTFGAAGVLHDSFHGAPPIFLVPGFFMVVFALYLLFGRLIVRHRKRLRTYYAVSDRRVVQLVDGRNRRFLSTMLDSLPTTQKALKRNGSGTLTFGQLDPRIAMIQGTGMWFPGMEQTCVVFEDIPDAAGVYRMIMELRDKKD
jgi:hypothetical protein